MAAKDEVMLTLIRSKRNGCRMLCTPALLLHHVTNRYSCDDRSLFEQDTKGGKLLPQQASFCNT